MEHKSSRQKVKAIPITKNKKPSVRFTEPEYQILSGDAKANRKTISQHIRDKCLKDNNIIIPHAYKIASLLHATQTSIQELGKLTDVTNLSNEVSKLVLTIKKEREKIEKGL